MITPSHTITLKKEKRVLENEIIDIKGNIRQHKRDINDLEDEISDLDDKIDKLVNELNIKEETLEEINDNISFFEPKKNQLSLIEM